MLNKKKLILLVVSMIFIGLCFSSIPFVCKIEKKNEAQSSADLIAQHIAFDIQRAREIIALTDTSFILLTSIGTEVRYTYNLEMLRRNGIDIRLPNAAEFSLAITPIVDTSHPTIEGEFFEIEVILKIKDKKYRSKVQVDFIAPASPL